MSSDAPRFSLRSLLFVVLVISLGLGFLGVLKQRSDRLRSKLEQLAKEDKATLKAIVRDVDAIRAKLGRAPKDEAELVALLGKPMPVVHDQGVPTSVRYYCNGDGYTLVYTLWATDDWVYDSDKPKDGWVQHYY